MTGMVINLIVNIIMVALLAVTISYCWMLNRRIKVLQDSKSELAQLLKHFDESTQRASDSIIALQTASKKIGENIQLRIDKANYLLDDLAFMIEKGGKLAEQLEAGVAVNRARNRVMAEEGSGDVPVQTGPAKSAPAAKPIPSDKDSREKTRASLEAMLEKIAGRSKTANTNTANKEAPPARSRSEQELLELLRAGFKG